MQKLIIYVLLFCFGSCTNDTIVKNISKVKLTHCDTTVSNVHMSNTRFSNRYLQKVCDTFIYYRCLFFGLDSPAYPIMYDLKKHQKNYLESDTGFESQSIYAYDDLYVGFESLGGLFYIKNDSLVLFSNLDRRDSIYMNKLFYRIQVDFPKEDIDTIKDKILNRRNLTVRAEI